MGVVLVGHVVVLPMMALLVMPYMIRKLTENGFVMLIPHTVNFLMYFFWCLVPAKFGKVGPDGKLTFSNPHGQCTPYTRSSQPQWYSSVANFTKGNMSA